MEALAESILVLGDRKQVGVEKGKGDGAVCWVFV